MAADSPSRSVRSRMLELLIRPLASYCLRHSYSFQDFLAVAKFVFVDLAAAEIRKTGKKVNASRLSVLTGLRRPEAVRVFIERLPAPKEPASILERVVGQWRHDRRFTAKNGQPRALHFRGEGCEFRKLVASVSKAINPGTVLFELQRRGYVEKTPKKVRLLKQSFSFQSDPQKSHALLAKDISALIQTVEENIAGRSRPGHLHLHTEYDNVFLEDLPKIRRWLIRRGEEFHRQSRNFISQFDKDINPRAAADKKPGGRVVVTSFSYTYGGEDDIDPASAPGQDSQA